MEDLSISIPDGKTLYPLGGGNPAHIPEIQALIRSAAETLVGDAVLFASTVGDYDSPQGNERLREILATKLMADCGWAVTADHIAITNGSQASFEILFNSLAGQFDDGTWRQLLLPMTPEYVGYTDMARQDQPLLKAQRANIELIGDRQFKYVLDQEALSEHRDIGAVCVSRPTNPSGNVLSDDEIDCLVDYSRGRGVPLIIDGAYGLPFPNMLYTPAAPRWDSNIILCLSLSKLGLPGIRTGIVVADPAITELIRNANAINGLAPGRFGPTLIAPMIENKAIDTALSSVLKPHYLNKQSLAIEALEEAASDLPIRFHKPEGAMFLWVWFEGLPSDSEAIYRDAIDEGVVTVPGHHFFQGLGSEWEHARQCMRINYAGDTDVVCEGIRRLITVARRHYLKKA